MAKYVTSDTNGAAGLTLGACARDQYLRASGYSTGTREREPMRAASSADLKALEDRLQELLVLLASFRRIRTVAAQSMPPSDDRVRLSRLKSAKTVRPIGVVSKRRLIFLGAKSRLASCMSNYPVE